MSITTPFTPCPPRVRNGGAAKPPSSPNLSIAGRRHGHGGSGLGAGQRFGCVVDRCVLQRLRLTACGCGGTLANLLAAFVFWMALRSARSASVGVRLFLLTNLPFNLFDGTGYFFFSGVTDFGDWAAVVRGRPAHWLWRGGLVCAGGGGALLGGGGPGGGGGGGGGGPRREAPPGGGNNVP